MPLNGSFVEMYCINHIKKHYLRKEWHMEKLDSLGKIQSVKFGSGGYQNAQFGIWFTFGADGWGVSDGMGVWQGKPSDSAKWTEQDKKEKMFEIMEYIERLLKEAKVSEVHELEGVPVEIKWDGMALKSWRILTEVI